MISYTHRCKHFDELSPEQLYSIIRLRNEVFVVEQHCVYQDADNIDLYCHHLALYRNDELVAYARLLPPGLSYTEMSIGRVISSPLARGTGAGKRVMHLAVSYCCQLFGRGKIRIGAQVYAKPFYAALGFWPTGEEYDEDGIAHIEMVKHPD